MPERDPREQKCCAVGCETWGVPIEGFSFYACDSCCERLKRLLDYKRSLEDALAQARRKNV